MANDELHDELSGRVAKGVEVLRGSAAQETGAGPSEELLRRTIERARSGARDEGTLILRRDWRMKMVRRFSVAAGVAVVAGAGILWTVWGRGAGVAFSDVLDQVKGIQAMRCHVEMELGKVSPGKKLSEEMLMVEPGWVVMEGTMDTVEGAGATSGSEGARVIMNREQHQVLMLMGSGSGKKLAMLMDLSKMPQGKQVPNLLEQFKSVQGKDSKPLGEKEINGVKVKGFEVVKEGSDMEVWADEKTERPVLAVMKMSNPTLGWNFSYTYSDFDWSPTYDAKELTLNAPEGYTLVKAQVDASEPKEEDVVTMLRTMTEMNNGEFPAGLGMKEFMPVMEKWAKAHSAEAKNDATIPAEMMNKIMGLGRGWAYIGKAADGTDWHYSGADVSVGEKRRIVLWYKPAGGNGWRAIDADLTARDVKESDLPKDVPVLKLDLTIPMPVGQ